jgi:hypothetical protein
MSLTRDSLPPIAATFKRDVAEQAQSVIAKQQTTNRRLNIFIITISTLPN